MRKQKPTGAQIAEKAKKARLDKGRSVRGEKGGKSIRFTGADLAGVNDMEELEEGEVVGVLTTELEGDQTSLPPGEYNVFLANVNGDWQGYFESGGQVVREATRVAVKRNHWGEEEIPTPRFRFESECLIDWCLIKVGRWCLLKISILCSP